MIGNKFLWSVVGSVFLLGLSLQSVSADPPRVKGELKKVQAALAVFKDPLKAIKAGYLSTVACVSFPKGAMGIHFINGRLIGQPLDPMKPQVLMYEPVGNILRLVAAE